jgi:ABC-2 type transport system permease protein
VLIPFLAMVRKDLRLFFTDRRAVLLTFAAPIAIASFIGSITQNAGRSTSARISVAIVDEDGSTISKTIVADVQKDENLTVVTTTAADARERVRRGTSSVALILPRGFGESAGRSLFRPAAIQARPQLDVLFDPSRTAEVGMVRGIFTEHAMQAVSQEMFSGSTGRQNIQETLNALDSSSMPADTKARLRTMLAGILAFQQAVPAAPQGSTSAVFSMPYTVREEAVTARANVTYNAYAHSVAGMAIQFLLFAMANHGIEILTERQRGIWKRLRSAPVSRYLILAGKAASGAVISLTSLLISFAFAMLVFGVRIEGSLVGFAAICVACSLMAATLGVLVATLGNSPATARGLTTFGILMMVMLGGAWVPMFLFPAWLQRDARHPHPLGDRRPRCDDLARRRPDGRHRTHADAARFCRPRLRRLRSRVFAGKKDSNVA